MNAADLSQSVKTRTGSLMGTPIYMSPEQCKGAGDLDSRTDIYSLGVMLYEMLAGRPPFVAAGVGELFAMHMLQQPPPVTDFAPRTPPMMAAAVMKALAKDPRDRFATMEELRQAFLADNLPMPTYRASGRTQNYRSQPASTLPMPAAHASTTLSASPREVAANTLAGEKKKSRAGLVLGAVVLAGGAATYLFMVPKGTKNAEPAPASATEPAAAPVASKMVTVRFESDPPGAHVARVTDEKDLGAVPFELKLPRAGGKPEYRFHLDGYQDQTLAADLASDLTLKATLEKTPAPPPQAQPATPPPPAAPAAHAETSHRPAATPHHTPRPARPSGDDDGLATPKF
jgi:serine/threonine-protein kinase